MSPECNAQKVERCKEESARRLWMCEAGGFDCEVRRREQETTI